MSYPKTWSPRRVIATAGIAAVAVSLAFAVPQLVSSQAARRQANLANRMQERGIPYGQADALEVYRDQYVAILTNLHEVSTIYGGNAPSQGEMSLSNAQASAQQAIQVVRDLTAEELSVMMQTLPDITPLLYDTVDLVTIARADRATQLGLTLGGPTRTSIGTPGENFASSGFPNAPYSSEVGSTRPTTAATLAASATFETAEGVREGASRACDETIVAIGAGGNTSLVCIAADLVWITAKTVFRASSSRSMTSTAPRSTAPTCEPGTCTRTSSRCRVHSTRTTRTSTRTSPTTTPTSRTGSRLTTSTSTRTSPRTMPTSIATSQRTTPTSTAT